MQAELFTQLFGNTVSSTGFMQCQMKYGKMVRKDVVWKAAVEAYLDLLFRFRTKK
jgi:hypothetical protein